MRRRKERQRPGSLGKITQMLAAGFLALWLGCMWCLTSITAEEAVSSYQGDYGDKAQDLADYHMERWLDLDVSDHENYWENRLWETVSNNLRFHGSSRFPVDGEWGFIELRDVDRAFGAIAVYDAEGNCLEGSWNDFFHFEYMTEEDWEAKEERSYNYARAFFDREKLTEEGLERVSNGQMQDDARAMRFTGTFDGVEFVPTKVECVDYDVFRDALMERGSGYYTVSGVVQERELPWITLYENAEAVPAGTETVTLYSDWFEVCFTEASPSFSYLGKKYSGVDELLKELGPTLAEKEQNLDRIEGLDMLIVDAAYCQSYEGDFYFGSYAGEDAYLGEGPEMHFYVVSAVYCSPWRTAMAELLYVYIGTFLLGLICLVMIGGRIRDHLIAPIREASGARRKDWALINFDNDPPQWREAWEVQHDYVDSREYRRMKENEIKRLETALEYARTAEENRRQMTSNIAHELKTPLAVVHSYAEGLQAHIAAEKRDRYLEVILSETERMDAMVLEMLDLSRLEAGKVKLARDDFDLAELAKSVFDTLQIQAEAKGLGISLQFPEKAMLAADEGRIRQVVENFASNAVKYTAAGGSVTARIFREGGKTVFAVENDSQPLSDEALEKVWDTFWRVDESRTGGVGTGLGLAIARSIVELHGGRVGVRNTARGVEFRFGI